ncbi:grasp-with-spasm system SPASM domain peptide maturase [Chryseobacterium lactis]|uniref:Grasp-with-spasm system SPASM domain peptide maturase n=1 Tax=Chryseobacterium lactis TaxID=1241981 RepID=A0A3G6RG78_CHRLC|nr:grasp-with-spasm system SPASM domain peptide maturase [Chryseobacterium lactis]AZA82471.1 grasp-with-spasm system SPASM domain peptide maturase [Chryseobacterium lactis]AZB02853.1 grasp-with-spasm system SPASM domain peptide maturase [Chryseobacterium lactis]PNW13853.1 grasp-with-spasm system SPASM domain peptide maturase [Chryseobacterium lactis]
MNYFKLFPNIKIAKGRVNAVLHDIERGKIEFLPLDFTDLLSELDQGKTIHEVKQQYPEQEQSVIDANLDYMVRSEFGIYCSAELFSCFPPMSTEFQVPSEITNAIIELKLSSIYYLADYLSQLEDLGCFDISIVFYEQINEKCFLDIFSQIPQNRIKSIEIISMWHEEINDTFFMRLNPHCPQVCKMVFTSSPFDSVAPWDQTKNILFHRQFVTKEINNFSHCGKIDLKNFGINLPKFTEAVSYNSCLHKKIAIDIHGNIKNCPAMPTNFGHVKTTKLKDAALSQNFRAYWDMNKDKISICRDCEFRYVCTDCRAYTERNSFDKSELDNSKPLKCGYDPYRGVWEDWSTNPLKQNALVYYNLQALNGIIND